MRTSAAIVSVILFAACTKQSEPPANASADAPADTSATAPATSASSNPSIQAALEAPDRFASDAEQDSWRKPTAIIEMLEVQPGMKVVDYLAGGGYYTELLSRLVGPEGEVVAYNNDAYLNYAKDEPARRYGGNRLPNVRQVASKPEELPLEPGQYDAALMVQSYHDLHWVSKEGHWPATDPAASLRKVAEALRPGGVVVVVDHVAQAGSDPAISVDKLHRIDPEIIKRDFEAAGFRFEGESEALRNSADKYDAEVFDAAVRHRTDQVIYKFRKN
jgi:predicted methyltransferase